METDDPLPLSAIEGLVPALLKVYSLVHEVSYETREPLSTRPTPQELVEAVRHPYILLFVSNQ
jgi:hypothetical protein